MDLDRVPDEFIERAFNRMKACPQHTFLVLTKRPGRMAEWFDNVWYFNHGDTPNIWPGTTVENQGMLDKRWPDLSRIQSKNLWLSVEPMLGPIDISVSIGKLAWIVCGGETGPHARPMHAGWARSLRDQCHEAGISFYMKQMSKREIIPKDLMIRERPNAI